MRENGLNLSRNEIIYVNIFQDDCKNGYVPWAFSLNLYPNNSKPDIAFPLKHSLSQYNKNVFYSSYLAEPYIVDAINI